MKQAKTEVKSDQVIKNNLVPSQDQLIRAKRFFAWYCIVSVTFLIAAISNLMDYNHRKIVFFADVVIFMIAINEAKSAHEKLTVIKLAQKDKADKPKK